MFFFLENIWRFKFWKRVIWGNEALYISGLFHRYKYILLLPLLFCIFFLPWFSNIFLRFNTLWGCAYSACCLYSQLHFQCDILYSRTSWQKIKYRMWICKMKRKYFFACKIRHYISFRQDEIFSVNLHIYPSFHLFSFSLYSSFFLRAVTLKCVSHLSFSDILRFLAMYSAFTWQGQ
jgi:hypothetical protein